MTFSEDMNRAIVNMRNVSEARVRKVALAAYREINKRSPVDKGTFRANWVASVDTVDRSSDLSKTSKNVNESVTAATAVITNGAKLGTTVYISNSVPYAGKLEDGYSPQAPAGVVAPALTTIKNAIEEGRL
jgi:hypothetical protein